MILVILVIIAQFNAGDSLFSLQSKREELFLMHCLERIMNQEDIDKIQKDFIHYYEKT